VRGRLHRFSTRDDVEAGACVRDGAIVLRTAAGEDVVMPASELPVPGEHNLANALAAALACRLCGCSPEAIAAGLRAYRALPHRLEFVASLDGVDFYNDSKATNLDAALRALRSFPAGRVHLLLGGKDKGADWAAAAPEITERARTVFLVGAAAPVIAAALGPGASVRSSGTVRSAVREAFEIASPGEVVLLAPGCASFDQYRNFEERGLDFQHAVEALFPDGGHRA
jgi:UDP-N-acetylmuramoylalanine--D-glutamate ligase